MNLNSHAITLWVGIVGSAFGVYFPIHSELKQQKVEETQRAVQRQQNLDKLNRRLENIEGHLQFIDETLPQHDKALAQRIFAQVQQQVQNSQQVAEPVMYEKSVSKLAMHRMTTVEVPSASADAPAIPSPEVAHQ